MANQRYYNPETSQYQSVPYQETSGRSSGTSPNVAQQQIGAEVAGTTIQAGTGLIGGLVQRRANLNARKDAREEASINRNYDIAQKNREFNIKSQLQEQELKMFELNKIEQRENLRHETWLSEFNKALERGKRLKEIVNNIVPNINTIEDKKNIIVSNFGTKK